MLCDIGNGTMNIMYINNGLPISNQCYTEKFGTHQCMLAAREALMRRLYIKVDELQNAGRLFVVSTTSFCSSGAFKAYFLKLT